MIFDVFLLRNEQMMCFYKLEMKKCVNSAFLSLLYDGLKCRKHEYTAM